MFIALPVIALLLSLAILFSLCRPRRLPPGTASAEKISLIIPARDEEENIGKLLRSICGQETRALEILVIDDQSSDRTAEVAGEQGATVIAGKMLPETWRGKTWACQQGAEAARGEWFLFLDADVTLLPGSLAKLAALTSHKAVHSICPHHQVRRPYEQLSAFFNTITLVGVDAFAATPSRQGALFGQVLLIHRDHYQKAGGHRSVKDQVLENFHFGQVLRAKKIAVQCHLGQGNVEMRMFPHGPAQLVNSWKKGFLSGAARSPKRALLTTSLWLSGGMILTGCLAALPFLSQDFARVTLVTSALYALLCFYAFRLAGRFSFLTAALFPIPLFFYQIIFFKSLLDQKKSRPQTWKGRSLG